jgi:hypothetical protein
VALEVVVEYEGSGNGCLMFAVGYLFRAVRYSELAVGYLLNPCGSSKNSSVKYIKSFVKK